MIALLAVGAGCRDAPPARPPEATATRRPGIESRQPPTPRDFRRGTHLVLLGTGTPNATPERSGPAVAVVAEGIAYLVDAGPGVVRRASAAAERGVAALEAPRLDVVFLTHLHSDHTVGLPDLVYTSWVLGREGPLRVFGPDGTEAMADHLAAAWEADVRNRLQGLQPATPEGWRIDASDVDPGTVYEDERVRVTAFAVPHTDWSEAFGYRFDTADRSIVISGDTEPSDAVIAACDGCDVLVHEVYSARAFQRLPPEWRRYHAGAHTSATELARIAGRARPGLLVLYHHLLWGATPEALVAELRAGYDGNVAFGRDLDVF